MRTIILQNVSTKETRTVKQAILLSDKDEYKLIRSDIVELSKHKDDLLNRAVPIGSVEFVREAMNVAGIKEPEIHPYPIREYKFLQREISSTTLKELLTSLFEFTGNFKKFIKPKKIKLFTGFVFGVDSSQRYDSDFLHEQLCLLLRNPDEELFVSDVVDFLSEWRYYINDGQILGYARYDEEGDDGAPEPDINIVKEYVYLYEFFLNVIYTKRHTNPPYVLDFGVLSTGETALVEYNAPWAIGLYGDALTPKQYLKFLIDGWDYMELINER